MPLTFALPKESLAFTDAFSRCADEAAAFGAGAPSSRLSEAALMDPSLWLQRARLLRSNDGDKGCKGSCEGETETEAEIWGQVKGDIIFERKQPRKPLIVECELYQIGEHPLPPPQKRACHKQHHKTCPRDPAA